MSAIEDLQAALQAGFKERQEGTLSDPDGSLVQLARAFIPRHLRPTEWGIEDVESHWRDLPEADRQAILDQMHAPVAPELQTLDRPETRPLRDLPPGLQAVYEAVKQNVGERKYAALQAKVEEGGGNPYERQAGYLKGGGNLPTGEAEVPKPVVYPDPGNQPYSDPDDPGNQPAGGSLPSSPSWDEKARGTLDELLGADVVGPETIAEVQYQIESMDPVETLAELIRTDLVDEESLLDNGLTWDELSAIQHTASIRAQLRGA